MPTRAGGRLGRRLTPSIFVLVLLAVVYLIARLPQASAEDRAAVASRFSFSEHAIALPEGLPLRTVREVNPAYEHIKSWVSSVGAGIAVNDLDGGGVANDLCVVDSRTDTVSISQAPGAEAAYPVFVLDPKPLPMNAHMAPMGCVPGDFNLDGGMDVLVYYWGRTPVLFMKLPGNAPLSPASYCPIELMPMPSSEGGVYTGQLWNTNAVTVADFDGDGRPDLGVFNYFPDSEVLNPQGLANVQMNHSMSSARNAGGAHILRWTGATSGDKPSVTFEEQKAMDPAVATGWTLAAGTADIDGDLLPELYVANDFGNDRFFYNVSKPGNIRFEIAEGRKGAFTPKSLVVGKDSFKSMGVDFGDLSGNGRFDMFVSNITVDWGLEESNFVWQNTSTGFGDAREKLRDGHAPFDNRAADMNLAWSGWNWDAKMADLDNSGRLSVLQTAGFVDGDYNRWPWLQEFVITNDVLLSEPQMWPHMRPGDDVAGEQPLLLFAREDNGRYVNIAPDLGITTTTPTRGIAVADVDGDGAQDFAVARQWGEPCFYHNERAARSDFLGLRLYRPVLDGSAAHGTPGAPAYGAQVRITMPDGRTQVAQLDGASGHSGKRSFDVFFGLGESVTGPITVDIIWRDLSGTFQRENIQLNQGWHDLLLTNQAQEVTR